MDRYFFACANIQNNQESFRFDTTSIRGKLTIFLSRHKETSVWSQLRSRFSRARLLRKRVNTNGILFALEAFVKGVGAVTIF